MRDTKGFNAKVVCRHREHMPGELMYIKACKWKFSTPTLYKILDRKNGKTTGYINGNEFKNRFRTVDA